MNWYLGNKKKCNQEVCRSRLVGLGDCLDFEVRSSKNGLQGFLMSGRVHKGKEYKTESCWSKKKSQLEAKWKTEKI